MDEPQTWHHGVIAEWWGHFNDEFRAHEIPYFQGFLEEVEGAVLDAGCGSGRLLIPYLKAGFDVDGVDVSADMIEVCRRKAEAEGLEPFLGVQALHELDLPRTYRTIIVCGTFGLGSDRERDQQALRRLHRHLEPGGTLLLDNEVPYADRWLWEYWPKEKRQELPEPRAAPSKRRRAPDGSEYALVSRVVELDPLTQHARREMVAERWRDGVLEASETHVIDIGMYFTPEVVAMLHAAGFADVAVHGEHERRPATPDDDFVVFVATK